METKKGAPPNELASKPSESSRPDYPLSDEQTSMDPSVQPDPKYMWKKRVKKKWRKKFAKSENPQENNNPRLSLASGL